MKVEGFSCLHLSLFCLMPTSELEKSKYNSLNVHISKYMQVENGATDTTHKVHKLTE